MKSFVVSRLALLGSAAAFVLAACSSEKPASDVAGPDFSPQAVIATPGSFTLGTPVPGYIQVCVDGTSQDLAYVINVTGAANDATVGVAVTNPVNLTKGNCAIALARTINLSSSPISTVTLTVANAGVVTYTCSFANVVNVATDGPFCGTGVFGSPSVTIGSGAAVSSANANHGSVVTFRLEQPIVVVPPPPPSPPIGCTYTQGWWKNKGAAVTAQFDFDGGSNNGLTVLNTTPRGNPYYILAHQYIAAALNVSSGASMTGSVLTAFNSATTYFVAADAATPLPGSYTKAGVTALATALDNYNNGLTGPGHCG